MFTKSLKSEVIGFPLTNDTDQTDGEADAELTIRKDTELRMANRENIR